MSTSASALVGESGTLLRTYRLANHRFLTLAQGSVVDFASKKGAIVNAANEGCLFGGGVDGAITSAGGPNLAEDRRKLPRISSDVRCHTGDAKVTGPGDYGDLRVPFVIHAVGPNYWMYDEDGDVQTPHRLLYSAYKSALDCTVDQPIKEVAFALLSAGVFRGGQSLGRVLAIGVSAIRDWAEDNSNSSVTDIVLYAFTNREAKTLLHVCHRILLDNGGHSASGDSAATVDTSEKEEDADASTKGAADKEASAEVPQEDDDKMQASASMDDETGDSKAKEPAGAGEEVEATQEGECPDETMMNDDKEEAKQSSTTEGATPDTGKSDDAAANDDEKNS
ncbi:Macro domain-containing protein [Seminavis robusta]|uniref:Macro domain-containing protein n=1 Tax=Seminavis robusta TaxID=568900 RepID=A0A9N8DTF2_9STRA|nr:Macro domain-containing protein [Seminavis robusta]|eukprot:Sro357_g125640.1 Macro domain-containing protein (337) ;mRNA; f:34628-35638